MKSHKDLDIYKLSLELVYKIYNITKEYPNDELYGITSQMKRSALSVPSNIAEGAGRKGNKEFIHFLYISLGSLAELETQLDISVGLGFLKSDINNDIQKNIKKIRHKMLRLIETLIE